tara:strand:- start:1019 stop:1426 length:408 start_codon:yes stop_codon:yes gene_type:complete
MMMRLRRIMGLILTPMTIMEVLTDTVIIMLMMNSLLMVVRSQRTGRIEGGGRSGEERKSGWNRIRVFSIRGLEIIIATTLELVGSMGTGVTCISRDSMGIMDITPTGNSRVSMVKFNRGSTRITVNRGITRVTSI